MNQVYCVGCYDILNGIEGLFHLLFCKRGLANKCYKILQKLINYENKKVPVISQVLQNQCVIYTVLNTINNTREQVCNLVSNQMLLDINELDIRLIYVELQKLKYNPDDFQLNLCQWCNIFVNGKTIFIHFLFCPQKIFGQILQIAKLKQFSYNLSIMEQIDYKLSQNEYSQSLTTSKLEQIQDETSNYILDELTCEKCYIQFNTVQLLQTHTFEQHPFVWE